MRKIISIFLIAITIMMCFSGCSKANIKKVEETVAEIAVKSGKLEKPSENKDYKYNIYTTYIELVSYIGEAKDVVIPETIEEKPVYVIGPQCFLNNKNITSIKIYDECMLIKKSAFEGCSELKTLKLPEKIKTIPSKMCFGCTNLESITFPESVIEIQSQAFAQCNQITKVVIPRRTQEVQDSAFKECASLEEVVFIDGTVVENNEVVEVYEKKIGNGAFAKCESLKKVILPDTVIAVNDSCFKKSPPKGQTPTIIDIYGYISTPTAQMCVNNYELYKFIEIKEGDEIDKLIKVRVVQK